MFFCFMKLKFPDDIQKDIGLVCKFHSLAIDKV